MKMNENQGGSNNLLDTTDCLEAVGVFKGWKNLLFIIVIICLLLLQLSFWLINIGCVSVPKKRATIGEFRMTMQPVKAEFKQNMAQDANEAEEETAAEPEQAVEDESEETNEPAVASEETAEQEETTETEQTTEPEEPAKAREPVPVMRVQITDSEQAEQAAPEIVTQEIPVTAEVEETKSFLFGITFGHLVWLIRFLNAVLILGATLYCLTMLFSLKVSMLGRLGGINHITRAFFLSLLALILLLPWHEVFNGVALGAMFTSDEIVEWYSARTGDLFDTILYYLRFCAFWLLIVLLLVLAQVRSSRWAAAILRRLEVI
jgi:hypothetical protein